MNLWPCFVRCKWRKGAGIIEFLLFNDVLRTVGHDWFWNFAEVMGVMTMMWGTSLIVGVEAMQIEKYSCNWTGWQRHKLGWNAKSIIAILAWNPPRELNFIYHRHHDPHTCRDSIFKKQLPLKQTCTWKWTVGVGILVSFWDGQFLGANC